MSYVGYLFQDKTENHETLSKTPYNFFLILNHIYWDSKLLLEKAKPTLVDGSPDKPKALIRNVASQPLNKKL